MLLDALRSLEKGTFAHHQSTWELLEPWSCVDIYSNYANRFSLKQLLTCRELCMWQTMGLTLGVPLFKRQWMLHWIELSPVVNFLCHITDKFRHTSTIGLIDLTHTTRWNPKFWLWLISWVMKQDLLLCPTQLMIISKSLKDHLKQSLTPAKFHMAFVCPIVESEQSDFACLVKTIRTVYLIPPHLTNAYCICRHRHYIINLSSTSVLELNPIVTKLLTFLFLWRNLCKVILRTVLGRDALD